MMAHDTKILDGKAIAQKVQTELKTQVGSLIQQGLRAPGLCTILVGSDPASQLYVRNKGKRAREVGIESFHFDLPPDTSAENLFELIANLNLDPRVDGILVQLPLPSHIDSGLVSLAIDPRKDVDGLHPDNVGRLFSGRPRIVPCTPLGVMRILQEAHINLLGKNAVVVGRSNIVGRPMAAALLNADASVAICHLHSADIKDFTLSADVLVVAAGAPGLITANHIKAGATLIDVGINRLSNGSIVGDVDFESVQGKAEFVTPVPGGVGPMTIAMLLQNTLTAYREIEQSKG